jgi:hypothetical protein
MPFVGALAQDVQNRALCSARIVCADTGGARDSVGRRKPDALDLLGQAVGLLLDRPGRLVAVAFVQAPSDGRADPERS